MRFISYTPILVLFCASSAFAIQDCQLNGKDINPDNGATTEGKSGMMQCRDRDSGQLMREEELRNGKFVGLLRYYEDGKLAREYTIDDNGNRDGRAREFYADGSVAKEETYRDGDTVGLGRTWYETRELKRIYVLNDSGDTLAEAEFNVNGQLTDLSCADHPVMGKAYDDVALCGFGASGPVTQKLYSDKGRVKALVTLDKGNPVLSKSLWENGKARTVKSFSGGGISGKDTWIEISFSANGVKQHEVHWVADGRRRVKALEQDFSDSGKETSESQWKDGILVSTRSWYLNGQPKTTCQYTRQGDAILNQRTEYYDNGKPSEQGQYLEGDYGSEDPVGTIRSFDRDGHLQEESVYDDDGRLTRERKFDASGTVVSDDAVFEDGSRKAFTTP